MIDSKFEDPISVDRKANCEECRKGLYNDHEIYLIIFDPPREGFDKIIKQPEKIRLCRNCYVSEREVVLTRIYEKKRSA